MVYSRRMKFDKGLLPRSQGPRRLGLVVLLVGLAACAWLAIVNDLPSQALAALQPPAPTPVAVVAVATATPTPAALFSPAPTDLPASGSPTSTEPPPTPVPTATWFYEIPANPTPIPTPVLPAAAPFPASCDGPGRMNILLIGIDGFDSGYSRAARADTIILVGVNFSSKSAQMLSFPRDLWVQLPNISQVPEARINTAYHYGELYAVPGGGPAELGAVMANTFGLRVDRFAVVNFLAFEQGIDAIGGIDINLPEPIHDGNYPMRDGSGRTIAIDFPSGWVHMDGSAALIYARTRHDSSDFKRMRRQQQVLFAVRDKLLKPETVPQLPALAQILFNAVDTDLSLQDIALLGCLGPQVDQSAIQSSVIDGRLVQPSTLQDGAQILLPNMDAIQPILQSFNTGE
jgi:polyisoprenyl-teichoic acid--peptidoglycan teichoic acid transferase